MRKIKSHLNILCLLLPNVLIQLNEDICRKTCYVLHFVVCLFAYIASMFNTLSLHMCSSEVDFRKNTHITEPWMGSSVNGFGAGYSGNET